ncbi:Uncharacterised protein [Yersinia enterocolitica]|nr:Uncharacterised protein [Yersinia enterocolitica]
MSKGAELLAFSDQNFAIGIGNIGQRFTIAFLCHFFWLWIVWRQVIPSHIEHLLWHCATFAAVHITQTTKDTGQNSAIVQCFARRISTFPVPLQPAAGVNNRTVFFSKTGGWQAEYLGLNFRWIDFVKFTVVLPEIRGFSIERVNSHQEFQFRQ